MKYVINNITIVSCIIVLFISIVVVSLFGVDYVNNVEAEYSNYRYAIYILIALMWPFICIVTINSRRDMNEDMYCDNRSVVIRIILNMWARIIVFILLFESIIIDPIWV